MHANPFCIGLNCALGAEIMLPFYKRLVSISTSYVHAYPNAGLPNEMGGYDETPEEFAKSMRGFVEAGINMVGGCCGTNHKFIKKLAEEVVHAPVRKLIHRQPYTRLSGMDEFVFYESMNFVNIGERCNLAGSSIFKKLIKDNEWDKASDIAKKQVIDGAQLLDICLDDGLIDGVQAMRKFLRLIMPNYAIASVPVVIDSSNFNIVHEGLKNCQGKSIVNSISMKEGEEEFIKQAKICQRFGAAVIVMAFD